MSNYVFVIDELEFPETSEQVETNLGAIDTSHVTLLGDTSQAISATTAVNPLNIYENASLNNLIISGPQAINIENTAPINNVNFINNHSEQNNRAHCKVIAFKIFNMFEISEKSNGSPREVKIWQQYRWCCFLCAYYYDYYKLLTNHLRDSHNIISEDDIRYQCSDCGRVIDEYSTFLNHIRQHHPQLKTSCDVCGRSYEKYERLAEHRETAHTNQTNLRPKVFYCNQCELTFSTKEQVDCHCENHIWICPTCNQEFDKKNEFFQHKITHAIERNNTNHEENYNCDICLHKFSARPELWSHLEIHVLELPFKCSKCPARFKTLEECSSHAAIHDMVRCKYCPLIFYDPHLYSTHVKSHLYQKNRSVNEVASEPKRFSCKKCGKIFRSGLDQVKHTKFACLRHSLAFRMSTKTK